MRAAIYLFAGAIFAIIGMAGVTLIQRMSNINNTITPQNITTTGQQESSNSTQDNSYIDAQDCIDRNIINAKTEAATRVIARMCNDKFFNIYSSLRQSQFEISPYLVDIDTMKEECTIIILVKNKTSMAFTSVVISDGRHELTKLDTIIMPGRSQRIGITKCDNRNIHPVVSKASGSHLP